MGAPLLGGRNRLDHPPLFLLLRRSHAPILAIYMLDNKKIKASTQLLGLLSQLPVIKACWCTLPAIGRSEILSIGTLFDRPQPGTLIGRKWDFFRLLLPSSCGQFCSRSLSDPNPTIFWEDEMERREIPHFRAEALL